VNYMVAVDDSENARAAFYQAVTMINRDRDHLYIIAVAEDTLKYAFVTPGFVPPSIYLNAQAQVNKDTSILLHKYGKFCDKAGIKHTLLLGVSSHIGEMITQAADTKNVDFLVIGRRGMGKIKRLFVGSTSKYCVEHCKCNVMVVKGEWKALVDNPTIKEIIEFDNLEKQKSKEEFHKHAEENNRTLEKERGKGVKQKQTLQKTLRKTGNFQKSSGVIVVRAFFIHARASEGRFPPLRSLGMCWCMLDGGEG